MGTVTPVVVPGEGYVRVEVNWQDWPHTRKCWIYRLLDTPVRLREGNAVPLSNGVAVAFDHEAPLDTPLRYRTAIALNANGDFEDGVSEWTDATNSGTVGTVTQSRDYYVRGEGLASAKLTPSGAATSKAVSEIIPIPVSTRNANPFFEVNAANWSGVNGAGVSRDTGTPGHEGVASLLIVPNGVGSVPQAQSEEVAVVAGQSYTYAAWLRVSSGGSLSRDVGIAWFNAAHALLSSNVSTLTPAPTVWTQYVPTTVVAPAGAAFARLITNGPGVLAGANTWRVDEFILWDATLARTYTILGRLMVPNYWSGGIGVKIQWYYGTTLLGTTGAFNDFAPFPGDWGSYGFSATDMATANGMRAVYGIDGTPPTTLPVYGDEVYITTSGTTVDTAGTVTVPSNGVGWWTDPLHPATKVRLQVDLQFRLQRGGGGVAYLGLTDETFPADSSLLEVNDAVNPAATWSRRKSGRQGIRLATETLADLAAVRALHASGAPLFLQLHAAYGETDSYGLHGDLAIARAHPEQKVPWRIVGSSFGKTGPPTGPPEGTLKTRYMDLNRYPTFAAATSAGATWLDVLQGKLAL